MTPPTYDALYAFLKSRYKRERFEGRNDRDYPNYSGLLTQGRLRTLEERGWDMISRHESMTGEAIMYNMVLQEFATDRSFWSMTRDEQRDYANADPADEPPPGGPGEDAPGPGDPTGPHV